MSKFNREQFNKKFSALMDRLGAFFAFSNKQFAEKAKDGVQYVNGGAGLIIPKDNVKEFWAEFEKL